MVGPFKFHSVPSGSTIYASTARAYALAYAPALLVPIPSPLLVLDILQLGIKYGLSIEMPLEIYSSPGPLINKPLKLPPHL